MEFEICSLICGFPSLPGPLERSSTVVLFKVAAHRPYYVANFLKIKRTTNKSKGMAEQHWVTFPLCLALGPLTNDLVRCQHMRQFHLFMVGDARKI